MKILGVDPGLATVGLGLIETDKARRCRLLEWLTIETDAHMPFAERLQEIAHDLSAYVAEQKPDLAVVETLYFKANRKTAMDVAHARGVILQTLAAHCIPILEPNPMQLKSAITGDGNADKKQMQDMIVRELHLKEIPSPDDAVDALGLALFGGFTHTPAHAAV